MTNQKITFNALNSFYLDTSDMKVNEGYLNDAIILWAMNTEWIYKAVRYGKGSVQGVIWSAFTDLVNNHIREIEYPYHQDCVCSSYQLKNWLNEYGNGYDTLKATKEYFEAEREDAKEWGER